ALAELDRPTQPGGEAREKRGDRVPSVRAELGPELHQQGAQLFAEQPGALAEQRQLLGVRSLRLGGELAWQFQREAESSRHPLRPAAHHVLARRRVIGRVDFDRAESPAIEGEEVVRLRASGIEGPHPGGVVPALCPEMDASADTYGFARRIRATPFVLRFRATSLCYVSVLRLFVVTGTYANTSSFP